MKAIFSLLFLFTAVAVADVTYQHTALACEERALYWAEYCQR